MSIVDDIKHQFRTGNLLMQLIYVNGGVFLVFVVLKLLGFLFQFELAETVFSWLKLPSNLGSLVFKPWTLITHIFTHTDPLHLLFNMITLFFSGQIFLGYLNSKQLLSTYILGGLSGAVLFILALNIFPAFDGINGIALGASAGILAILVAAAALVPNQVVRLALIGPIKLKYIAGFFVAIDLVFLPGGNAGGHIGHLGGALYGLFYGFKIKGGVDTSINFLSWVDNLKKAFKSKSKIKVVHRDTRSDDNFNERKVSKQKEVDAILDKISKSGYESLTASEKELLFKASKDI
ncbi:MAG: membrane associated rhomboid family serine protease [Bacteroidia bacterium]|jgi:membrane associated rhomboid family serine protease